MPNIFKAETSEAHYFKILADILANNLKTGYFVIDSKGMKLRMMDSPRTTLIDLNLYSDNFKTYKFKKEEDDSIHAGLNMTHLHKMLKSIKKKDYLQLIIEDKNINELKIKVIPKEKNARITSSYIKIQDTQNLEIELPEGGENSIMVLSSEFQKMCKDTLNMSNEVVVETNGNNIQFTCDTEGVMKRTVEFGCDDEDSDDEDEFSTQIFSCENISRIAKISGLSSNVKISPSETGLLFKTNVGTLGDISIYVKNKNQIEMDSGISSENSI